MACRGWSGRLRCLSYTGMQGSEAEKSVYTSIELLMLDVDGVLTDGRVVLGSEAEASKAFFVQDGCAIKLWQRNGGRTAILSGRSEGSVRERARELGIELVSTGASDKTTGFDNLLAYANVAATAVCYVGDDLPDLGPMSQCGLPVAVGNAAPAVKRAAAYVTRRPGGAGAVAEVVEWLLRGQNRWTIEPPPPV